MLKLWIGGSALTALLVTLLMLGFLVEQSWPFWRQYGIGMLFSGEWYPYEHLFGMPMPYRPISSMCATEATPLAEVCMSFCSKTLLPRRTLS